MNRKIIYVFGPLRLYEKYMNNEPLMREEGGWLKIGQTDAINANGNKWDIAHDRVIHEPRTGIPEVSRLYDVFEFPYKPGKVDDLIRNILAEDIYTFETSKQHNRGINGYEIKAGTEFVYGANRSQVLNAVFKYEHGLLMQDYDNTAMFNEVREMIRNNHEDETMDVSNDTDNDNMASAKSTEDNWNDQIFERIVKRLNHLNVKIVNPLGKAYAYFKSAKFPEFAYIFNISTRYNKINAGIETYNGGEPAMLMFDNVLEKTSIKNKYNIVKTQGVKRTIKWAWTVSDTLDKSDDEIVDFIVNVITDMFNEIENTNYGL
jgi:hypothetical protein